MAHGAGGVRHGGRSAASSIANHSVPSPSALCRCRRGRRATVEQQPRNTAASASVDAIHTFPVKGLPRVALEDVDLAAGGCLPADRRWAVIMGKNCHLWDPAVPSTMFIDKGLLGMHHGTKVKFHQLITDSVMAALDLKYRFDTDVLMLSYMGKHLTADLTTLEGIQAIEGFLVDLLDGQLKPSEDGSTPLKLVSAADGITHQFGNVGGTADKLLLHLINQESVRDFERKSGWKVDPLRFRANIMWQGGAAWEEWGWVGQKVRLGSAVLEFIEPTIRCPSTEVSPSTAERDLAGLPKRLQELYPGATATTSTGVEMALGGPESRGGYMGVYARVIELGVVRLGDSIGLL